MVPTTLRPMRRPESSSSRGGRSGLRRATSSMPAAISSKASFWLQMKVNELQMKGVRLKDMPDEWFTLPERTDNSMLASLAALCENRFMDMADFAAFNAVYEKYFTGKPARSCVAVKALPKGVLCEIEAIAEL